MSKDNKKKSDAAKVGHSFLGMFKRLFVHDKVEKDVLAEEALQTPGKVIFKNLIHNRLGVAGFIVFVAILLFSFVGSQLVPMRANYTELTNGNLKPGTNYLKYPKELDNKEIAQIVSGVSYGAAIDTDGKFYIWGTECNLEQDGVSDYIMSVPQEVYDNKIIYIQSGTNYMFAVDENHNIYSWGYYGNGQTKLSTQAEEALKESDVQQIVAKAQWAGLLTTDGELYIWGSTQAHMNFIVPSSAQGHITKVAAGDNNLAMLLDDGTIALAGDRGTEFATNIPAEMQDGSVKIVDIAATNRNVVATDENGELHLWGSSENGLNVMPDLDDEVVHVASGYKNFVATLANGEVVVWGANDLKQLKTPKDMSDIQQVYASYFQFYGIDGDGHIHAWGNKGYIFGSDQYGRDMLTRLIHGGRISLTVGAIAVVISTILAIIVGLTSGYFGGWVDHLLMRITDIFYAIPFYPIAVTLSFVIGNSISESARMYLIMVILGLLGWMGLAQLIRAQLLLEREKDFVLAAKALGIRQKGIMVRHSLPNVFNLIIVNITLNYASSLLSEAGLSFLGFGVAEPTPSWGNMLTSAQQSTVIQYYWWRWIIPGIFVIIAALSINMVGDALREAMDPRSNER